MRFFSKRTNLFVVICVLAGMINACSTQPPFTETPAPDTTITEEATLEVTATPIPSREVYAPGTLVDYLAQDGDTLPSVAAHFNTTEKEIRMVNADLPDQVTTLPPGLPMKIPIYYKALWGSPYQIMPNSLFVNGPAQIGFDTNAFVDSQPGWLKEYSALAGGETRQGADLIDYIADEYSISPRLLLAIAEYQAGALSNPALDDEKKDYPLGYQEIDHKGFYLQLNWAADQLNTGYYQWQTGRLDSINHMDGLLENPDPWQNAASVGIQYYFAQVMSVAEYQTAIFTGGLNATYTRLFGDPWQNATSIIPGSLMQPEFSLPFVGGKTWAFTGAPHSSWGSADPLGALDFAPPSVVGKCASTIETVVAMADGEISRSDTGLVMLDLDSDGDDRTGWVILYLHISSSNKVRQGTLVRQGDVLGYPSCEGGSATGTHIHVARKYNGEWIAADSAIPFIMEGWVPHNGTGAYKGTLTRAGHTVTASDNSAPTSMITAGK
jgi:murein DD-endopeptidase MepM/ murein hydrolase activator NlpD